ncbi:MAG: MlaD family protein [Bacteroidota bacterium]
MKISNEVKTGALAIIAIALAFWGYKYVQGNNILSRAQNYYAVYNSAAGVTPGTPVRMAGVSIGSVSEVTLDQNNLTARIDFNINPNIKIPPNTLATVKSISVLGEMAVDLTYTEPCSGPSDCLKNGSELRASTQNMFQAMLGAGEGENPLKEILAEMGKVVSQLDKRLFGDSSNHVMARTMRNLEATMINMNGASGKLNGMLAANSGPLNESMQNLVSFSEQLAEKKAELSLIIDNTEGFTDELSKLELEATLNQTRNLLDSVTLTMSNANSSMEGVDNIMTAIQNGEGTLGRLIYDEEMAATIERMSGSLDTLITDLAERPYRYIPFKSRKRVMKFDRRDTRDRADDVQMIPDEVEADRR